MRGHRNRSNPTPFGVILAVGLAACATASWAQDRGACVTADVPEAFALPDGTVHAAGRITLCTQQVLNPVTGLHRMQLADGEHSLAMSRRSRAEATGDTRPVLLFRRLAGAPLELVGYVLPCDRRSWSYALQRSTPKARTDPAVVVAARSKVEFVTLLASKGN